MGGMSKREQCIRLGSTRTVHGSTTPATPDDVPIPDAAGMDADWLNSLMTA